MKPVPYHSIMARRYFDCAQKQILLAENTTVDGCDHSDEAESTEPRGSVAAAGRSQPPAAACRNHGQANH